MSTFIQKHFKSHSGIRLEWKIECDSFTDEDWNTLAYLIAKRVRFSKVIGIPTGGLKLAQALQPYSEPDSNYPRLIVDDVLTTGNSMHQMRLYPSDIGFVVYARSRCPDWIQAVFYINSAIT